MVSSGDFVEELVVGWDPPEQPAGGTAALGRREARLLGEEYDVARHALRVKEPCLRADAVEAGALGVAGRGVVAQGRLLVAAARGEDEEKVVLEEEHVLGAWRQRLERAPARLRRGERVGAGPGGPERRQDERAGHAPLRRVGAEGPGQGHLEREPVPVPPERLVGRVA